MVYTQWTYWMAWNIIFVYKCVIFVKQSELISINVKNKLLKNEKLY